MLKGLCSDGRKLYCVEQGADDDTYWLAVYGIREPRDGSLRPLDSVQLTGANVGCRPQVDSSCRVYVPCRAAGVRIFRYDGIRLLSAKEPLTCVKIAGTLAVTAADTICVGDYSLSKYIWLVNVSTDTVIRRLNHPGSWYMYLLPRHVSVLGETVLACYGRTYLVLYHTDTTSSGQVLDISEEMEYVYNITTDRHSSFLVTDYKKSRLYVLDRSGNLRHWIPANNLQGCVLVQEELWMGYRSGSIAVMSSQ